MRNNNAVRVKICGITTPEDARLAAAAGADAIGLIFAEGSRRQISVDTALEVSAATGPFVQRVGVFRDQPLAEVIRTAAELRLDAVQLHGSEPADYVSEVRRQFTVIRAVGFREGLNSADLSAWPADFVLLDAVTPGAGRVFDWESARHLAGYPGLILAGGLTPDNVATAISVLRPAAVDTASGVETSPGRKSARLLEEFVRSSRSSGAVSTGEDAY